MNFFEFVQKWNGNQCDVDGKYGSQCVDLMRQYLKDVLEFSYYTLPPVDGAGDMWDKISIHDKDFQKIANLPWNTPKQGDIVLWKRSRALPFGHVAMNNSAGIFKLSCFGQNWDGKQRCSVTDNHNYIGCQGWLRKR